MVEIYDDVDVDTVSLCVWKEARGEGLVGMRAVAHVIKNRVANKDFPNDIHSVVYQKNQFTSMSVPTDKEFNLMPASNDIAFQTFKQFVPGVLDGSDEDPTLGACYYRNPRTATSGWFQRVIANDSLNHPKTVTIGRHDFYR
jgi:N-acetylmuramoyl-L-alanine amidase